MYHQRMRVDAVIGVLLTGILILDSGCHSGSSARVIAAIPRDGTAAYFVAEHAGLAEAAQRHKLSIYWNGPSGSDDNEQQIRLAERAIRNSDYGLVVTPAAPFALDTVLERALARGMPVVILGGAISLPPNRNLSFVLNDAAHSGVLAAERIYKLVGAHGEIALAGINPMTPGNTVCASAFEEELHSIAPDVHIVRHLTGAYTAGQAETSLEQVIDEHPHLAGIYALNVSITHGAVAAVRDTGAERRIAIVGNDQTLDLLFLVRQRVIDSLVLEDMRGMGQLAVENVLALREGRTVTPVSYLEPMLVDSKNIDGEAVQARLKMDWRPVS